MAKNTKRKLRKLKGRLNEARRGLAKLHPVTQGGRTAVMLNGATQYSVQKSALSPAKPNLSPNEIDTLKAVLGF
ncbi:MAG TPA: hypothetical protein VMT71_16385 [Syntrophorhabdales bacterium]|nr:hypothetical protein [Syntrophorhabdales bacterium]